jgi:hypothetical protein
MSGMGRNVPVDVATFSGFKRVARSFDDGGTLFAQMARVDAVVQLANLIDYLSFACVAKGSYHGHPNPTSTPSACGSPRFSATS